MNAGVGRDLPVSKYPLQQ